VLNNRQLVERIFQAPLAANEANVQAPGVNPELLHQQRFMNLEPLIPQRGAVDRAAQDPFFEGKVVPRGPRAVSQEPEDERLPYWKDFAGRP